MSADLGDYKPVVVMSEGDASPHLKTKIERTFDCPVINRYGMKSSSVSLPHNVDMAISTLTHRPTTSK